MSPSEFPIWTSEARAPTGAGSRQHGGWRCAPHGARLRRGLGTAMRSSQARRRNQAGRPLRSAPSREQSHAAAAQPGERRGVLHSGHARLPQRRAYRPRRRHCRRRRRRRRRPGFEHDDVLVDLPFVWQLPDLHEPNFQFVREPGRFHRIHAGRPRLASRNGLSARGQVRPTYACAPRPVPTRFFD